MTGGAQTRRHAIGLVLHLRVPNFARRTVGRDFDDGRPHGSEVARQHLGKIVGFHLDRIIQAMNCSNRVPLR